MLRRVHRVAARAILLAILAPACASRPIALPTGPGTLRADYASIFGSATAGCRDARTVTAELALSGRAGRQRLRGRVLAGLAPGALRLEGVAPFGAPAFIFVARDGDGTLLLPRDRRVLVSAPPADILHALAGVSLTPDDLRLLLAGCVKAAPVAVGGRAYGAEWIVVDLDGGGTAYLRRQEGGWHVVAGTYQRVTVEYSSFVNMMPQVVRVRSTGAAGAPQIDADLSVTLRQVEINGALGSQAFVLDVPQDAAPLTLDELEERGPLGTRR
jgi:hypothetical protein